MTLYMYVTKDKYELPILIEDDIKVLARKLKKKPNSISSAICYARAKGHRSQFVKVTIDEDDEEL